MPLSISFLAELGDYSPLHHSPGYASEFRFVTAQTEEMEEEVMIDESCSSFEITY